MEFSGCVAGVGCNAFTRYAAVVRAHVVTSVISGLLNKEFLLEPGVTCLVDSFISLYTLSSRLLLERYS